MKAIEFYTTPEGEVTMRPIGEAERQLKDATPMKGETLANLIQCGVTLLLGIIALAGALFCNASFHFFTAMACFWLAWVFYTDNEYGIVSVREYFKNRYKKD